MSADRRRHITIVGAGLAGALLATLLAQRGWQVDVFERRGDPRVAGYAGGRSINLALAERGLHALRSAGADDAVLDKAVMMRGRMVHFARRQPAVAALRPRRFGSDLVGQPRRAQHHPARCRRSRGRAPAFRPPPGPRRFRRAQRATSSTTATRSAPSMRSHALLGADGAGSALRAAMGSARDLGERIESLGHGYKELEIPPAPRWRLPHRTQRAAHLAARQLHVHRAAQRRAHVHRHAVPAQRRRSELRHRAAPAPTRARCSSATSPMRCR